MLLSDSCELSYILQICKRMSSSFVIIIGTFSVEFELLHKVCITVLISVSGIRAQSFENKPKFV